MTRTIPSTNTHTQPSTSISIDPAAYYRLTNAYLGTSQSLDVVNDGPNSRKLKMAASGNYSGQFWHFVLLNGPGSPNPHPNPRYSLRTQFRGEGFSLDVRNNAGTNSRSLQLAPTGNYSGQFWSITPWLDSTGTVRLTNDFTGPDVHLDTYADTHEPFLDTGNQSGQHWRMERIGEFRAE